MKGLDPSYRSIAIRLPYDRAMFLLAKPFLPLLNRLFPSGKGIRERHLKIGGIRVWTVEPTERRESRPFVFYIHGGGFAYGISPHQRMMAVEIARNTGALVAMPEYSLLPKSNLLRARREVASIYRYFLNRADKFEIDRTKTLLMGDSFGGYLSAWLLKDAKETPSGAMFLYPVVTPEMDEESRKRFKKAPLWDSSNDSRMWGMIGQGFDLEKASLLNGNLPSKDIPVYLETCGMDSLSAQGKLLGRELEKLGYKLEEHEVVGAPHGHDMKRKSPRTMEAWKKRIDFLLRLLADE